MSTANYAHLTQIEHDIEMITKALPKVDSMSTELPHFQAGELELAPTLNHTQSALNRTINLINHHRITVEHLVESHFLHTAITDILANRLNLNFIHHRDLNKVAKHIATATNVNFTAENLGPALIEFLSHLLIQQTIHFVPKTPSNQTESTLGTLSISSFFADTKYFLYLFTAQKINTPQPIQSTGRTLLSVTLITIPPKSTLLCDQFNIPASLEASNSLVTLWDFSLTNHTYGEKFDLTPYLQNDTRWSKMPFIPNELQEILLLNNTDPTTWDEFVKRFLAQQEHEWDECKQHENETINEFIVRLRSLRLEQKPDQDDDNFIKHLFWKMRTDMLTLMSANRSSTLTEIIKEAQKVEEILYLRNKEARMSCLIRLIL
ncbi:unnamed protein product [Adineta ricciae]|uniref:Uncharacterized protein n=1 Tax=Adineta ricciae TaxID=249248 RepID=A0A815B2L3_ADIRI|nr:unnamed protein product [Adineta ricciae]CAF1266342.1 unnamed protein product [Adineta ricciae]